jgi:hypothetical protein
MFEAFFFSVKTYKKYREEGSSFLFIKHHFHMSPLGVAIDDFGGELY